MEYEKLKIAQTHIEKAVINIFLKIDHIRKDKKNDTPSTWRGDGQDHAHLIFCHLVQQTSLFWIVK